MSTDIIDLPQSSPRLPSPPPPPSTAPPAIPELHINSSPTRSHAFKTGASSSPRLSESPNWSLSSSSASGRTGNDDNDDDDDDDDQEAAPFVATTTSQRIRPGTRATDMATGPPLVPLSQLDSPFQLQEYLKTLYQNYTHPKDASTVFPITYDIALRLAQPPEGAERLPWLYELSRLLTVKINNLVIAFFAQTPPCSMATCSQMRAAEWQYLCAVHDPPKECCAIDYCCHTLDWVSNVLTSPKHFPSRLTLGSEHGGGKLSSMRNLTNIFRRVYRIFAHAWFQHREAFWEVESAEGLYIFFKTVCDVYNLMPEESYTIPPEALGLKPEPEFTQPQQQQQQQPQSPNDGQVKRLTILRKFNKRPDRVSPERKDLKPLDIAATARRHRQSPSRGTSVGTIVEASEDDEVNKDYHNSAQGQAERLLGLAPHALELRGPKRQVSLGQLRENRLPIRTISERRHAPARTSPVRPSTVRIATHSEPAREPPVLRVPMGRPRTAGEGSPSRIKKVPPENPFKSLEDEGQPGPKEEPSPSPSQSLSTEGEKSPVKEVDTKENAIPTSSTPTSTLTPNENERGGDGINVMPQFLPETLP